MTVAVLTANFGGYDECVDPPKQSIDAIWHYFTDQPFASDVWTVTQVSGFDNPRLAAKGPKCRPDFYACADVTVWLDASCRLLHERSLEQLLFWSNGAPIAQFAHPERDCLFVEAQASAHREPKVLPQAQSYAMLHPPHWGLWATGVIVRNAPLARFGAHWLSEISHWSLQDQVSQPVVLAAHGLRPVSFPADLWENAAVGWAPRLAAA